MQRTSTSQTERPSAESPAPREPIGECSRRRVICTAGAAWYYLERRRVTERAAATGGELQMTNLAAVALVGVFVAVAVWSLIRGGKGGC